MRRFTSKGAYEGLSERAYPNIPLGRVREIAREYSSRYNVPIRVSGRAFSDEDITDAFLYAPGGGKYVIYLHPIVSYYSEEEIRASIEHELEHLVLERKCFERTKEGIEYHFGRPKKGYEIIE